MSQDSDPMEHMAGVMVVLTMMVFAVIGINNQESSVDQADPNTITISQEANQMSLYDQFYECYNKKQVADRIDEMQCQELREILTTYGCGVTDVVQTVCRQLQIFN